jgi:anti-sigma factor RsiW
VTRTDDISDEKLMRYLDGELSREEGRDVERALERPEVQARVQALTQLADVVRARSQAAEEEAAPQLAAMWDRVRAGLGSAPHPDRTPTLWSRVREWFESYRSHFLTGAFAAAAGALLAVLVTGGGRLAVGAPQEAQVDSLEVFGGSGSVYHFPDEKGEGTTVVWITPDEQPDEPAPTGTGGPI